MFRHEIKHEINALDVLSLRERLSVCLERDINAQGSTYTVTSLYFDTPDDRILREKLDGVCFRDKYRLRYYNDNTDFIRLEKKSKAYSLNQKKQHILIPEETKLLLEGHERFQLPDLNYSLFSELRDKMNSQLLNPKAVVSYTREAYTFDSGDVRITIDSKIQAFYPEEFLNPDAVPINSDSPTILEVKWTGFLPAFVRDLVQTGNRRSSAFSKYAFAREFVV